MINVDYYNLQHDYLQKTATWWAIEKYILCDNFNHIIAHPQSPIYIPWFDIFEARIIKNKYQQMFVRYHYVCPC